MLVVFTLSYINKTLIGLRVRESLSNSPFFTLKQTNLNLLSSMWTKINAPIAIKNGLSSVSFSNSLFRHQLSPYIESIEYTSTYIFNGSSILPTNDYVSFSRCRFSGLYPNVWFETSNVKILFCFFDKPYEKIFSNTQGASLVMDSCVFTGIEGAQSLTFISTQDTITIENNNFSLIRTSSFLIGSISSELTINHVYFHDIQTSEELFYDSFVVFSVITQMNCHHISFSFTLDQDYVSHLFLKSGNETTFSSIIFHDEKSNELTSNLMLNDKCKLAFKNCCFSKSLEVVNGFGKAICNLDDQLTIVMENCFKSSQCQFFVPIEMEYYQNEKEMLFVPENQADNFS